MKSTTQEENNLFDSLPDALVFTIFNKLHDAKSLCTCMSVCKRFNSIIPQVDFISLSIPTKSRKSHDHKSSLKNFVSKVVTRPLCFMLHLVKPRSRSPQGGHLLVYSLAQVLRPFKEIQALDIVLPSHGHYEIGSTSSNRNSNRKVLLRWKAEFGRQLQSCVILGATSFDKMDNSGAPFVVVNSPRQEGEGEGEGEGDDHGDDELPLTDDDLKLRIVWTISCLIAASARHYLLSQMLVEHQMVKQVNFSDASKQGRLCMNDDQIKELRNSFSSMYNKPGSSSSSSLPSLLEMRTRVPALRMKMWYAPEIELPGSGWKMKGATLMVVRPAEADQGDASKVNSDADLVLGAFDSEEQHVQVFNEVMRKLVESRRNYTLEMNSF